MTQDVSITAAKLVITAFAKLCAIMTWGFTLTAISVTLAVAAGDHDPIVVQLVAPFTGD